MNQPIRILHVEDSEDDHLLVHRELRRAGMVSTTERVDTPEAFRDALIREPWDVIVADFALPGFSGIEALEILNETGLDIPFILVSGTVGEDIAVKAMKRGASDYLLKGQLARLAPAIEREIREAGVRRTRREAASALKFTDDSLRHTVSLLRATIESTADGILASGEDGRVTIHNKKFRSVSGITHSVIDTGLVSEVVADILSRLRNPEDFSDIAGSLLRGAQPSGAPEGFRHLEFTDGRSVEAFVVPQWLEGRCVGHVICMRDVTERIRAEETRRRIEAQLFESQKMEALGSLAGGVAHDFNNLLSVILNYAELLRVKVGANPEADRYIDHMLKAGRRAADLVRQILLFSRRQKQELSPMRLQDSVSEGIQLLRSTIPKSAEIRLSLDGDTPPILADNTQIHQVLMNLCINAAQALPEKTGVITVAVTRESVSREAASIIPGARAGEYASLSVEDTGGGMDADTLARIFEPFFTTKQKGDGTGLGLAVVHGIVRSHNGFVTVKSAPGAGTTFRIYLPVHHEAVAASPTEPTAAPATGERILFVDDEPDICSVTGLVLTSLGYRVTTFSDSRKALEFFEKNSDDLDALLADVNMPGINGVELAQKFLTIRPGFPIVLISGFSGNWTPESVRKIGVLDLLTKPMSPRQIGARLKSVLHRRHR